MVVTIVTGTKVNDMMKCSLGSFVNKKNCTQLLRNNV